jgi:hypothetical protein
MDTTRFGNEPFTSLSSPFMKSMNEGCE